MSDSKPDTRTTALAVAKRLFVERGYSKTSMAAIAEEIGIAAPSLYWHFSSKEEILFSLIEQDLDRFITTITENVRDLSAADRVETMVRRYILIQLDRRPASPSAVIDGDAGASEALSYIRMLQIAELDHVLTDDHARQIRNMQRTVYHLFKAALEEGSATGAFNVEDASTVAFAIITLCENVQSWAKPGGRLGPDEICDQYTTLIRKMIM
ncbi:TetR/AcrR family transcriptional regulator [Rhodococcus sp. PSBB049]|uniref:TetR/AcrR family transcriptional regulator n=1 Tax=Rhodococcus sp. PSBB049 TaxID=2812863 RepID=UPI00197E4B77|nr:TetR/AcrR family transcriptional regulator [Rhodococcus sp. PSBB049]QSE72526.1 TetR family transcriptional regulator [Rhodococcus sp. PSBB049]